ncbi:MAG: NrfD/PsrC family molybdoenzyme membrane anchor subunit [Candidatus Competibacteraceae bacterium]|nr:NrfD/PsrC family molybdoenzyme membrane anchor subunit [Candidatus Competibacteraceae bacterium]
MAEQYRSVLPPGHSYGSITDRITATVLDFPTRRHYLAIFSLFLILTLLFIYGVWTVFEFGPGLMGVNIPVAWGYPITNVVWWIGIGHAGTLISAILLLLRQRWRTSINRFAEAMTLFAAGIAGFFPLLHLGRPWFAYWLVPYPSTMGAWPQWKSPLVWDAFAIGTYITVSLLFWYMGLVPDLASMRDRARNRYLKVIYGVFALGWRGSAQHWARYETVYLLLAALATPLVVSVHSIISLDFTITIIPGYHSTIFPPYFVAGALFSGFCMVITIAVPLRAMFALQDLITLRHFDVIGKVILASALVVAYGYFIEFFISWYSGSQFHRYMVINRALGPYAPAFWIVMVCNVLLIHVLWFRKVRTTVWLMFVLSLVFNVSMWLERYMIVFTSVHRDFMPSMWDTSFATHYDILILIGSLGLFFLLMVLLLRMVPALSIHELRQLAKEKGQQR